MTVLTKGKIGLQDVAVKSGAISSDTFTRPTSTGGSQNINYLLLDEDDMASNSATQGVTQQSLVEWVGSKAKYALDPDTGIIGDGTTPDTAAIHTLLSGSNKTIVFNAGYTYLIDANITITGDNVAVIATGANFLIDTDTNDDIFTISGDNFTWIGGTIDGNAANQSAGDWKAIFEGEQAADLTIKNATINDSSGYGIICWDCPRADVKRNQINDNVVGQAIMFVRSDPGSGNIYEGIDIEGPKIKGNYIDRASLGAATANATGGIDIRREKTAVKTGDQYINSEILGNTVVQSAAASANAFEGINLISDGATSAFNKIYGSTIGQTLANCTATTRGNQYFGCRDYGLEITLVNDLDLSGEIVDGQGVTGWGFYQTSASGTTRVTIDGLHVKNCVETANFYLMTDSTLSNSILDSSDNSGASIAFTSSPSMSVSNTRFIGHSAGSVIVLNEQDNITVTGGSLTGGTNGVTFYSTDGGYSPANVAFHGTHIDVTGAPIVMSSLASGTFTSVLFNHTTGDRIYLPSGSTSTNFIVHQEGTGAGAVNVGIGSTWSRRDGGEHTATYTRTTGTTGTTGWYPNRSMSPPSGVYQAAGCTNGTTAGKAKTVNTIYYTINGYQGTKAATDGLWDLTGVSTAAGEYKQVFLLLNISGTASISTGAAGASAVAAPYPDRAASTAVIGILTIPPSYSGGSLAGFTFNDMTGSWRDDY